MAAHLLHQAVHLLIDSLIQIGDLLWVLHLLRIQRELLFYSCR